MGTQLFSVDYPDNEKKVVRISFFEEKVSKSLLPELSSFFKNKLKQGLSNWVIDFANMPFPSTNFIAFVISATLQTREKGGDLKIINALESARNNFVSFSPLTYISFEDDVEQVLQDFSIEQYQPITTIDSNTFENVDIVDPPAIKGFIEPDEESKAKDEKKNTTLAIEKGTKSFDIKDEDTSTEDSPLTPEPETVENANNYFLKTESIASNLYKICDFVVEHARLAGMEEKQIVKTKIAVYEACLNVIEHAYHSRPDNWIEVNIEYTDEFFKVTIKDYGISFEKNNADEYDVEKAMEKRQTGGFGLHIIERSMDKVDYIADSANGNRLILMKFLKN